MCRAELSPADRAKQTARRKAIYLELHPETGNGKASPNKEENFSSFDKDTAAKIGVTDRLVRLNAERGEKVIEAADLGVFWEGIPTAASSSVVNGER